MNQEVKNVVAASDKEAQYDEKAKRLLAKKIILAHILVKTVGEFNGMNPRDVVSYIEGEPYISTVPVEPGLTNKKRRGKGSRITGLNTENGEIDEGLVRFDIIFYVRMRDGLSQIIVNLEVQKDNPSAYKILNRAIFYGCRMVSSQKERDFQKTNYDDIKQVYSIWICMNMKADCLHHIHFTSDCLLEEYEWPGNLDLVNIVMIGLKEELPENNERYELHRLLGTLFSRKLSVDEKLSIIGNEYDISIEEEFREDVSEMCNLGQGVREEGIAEGIIIGETRGIELGKARGIELGMECGIEHGLSALVSTLKNFISDAEELYQAVIRNEVYKNTPREEVLKYLK